MQYFMDKRNEFLQFLKEIVEIETPSHSPRAIAKLVEILERRFRELGCDTEILDGSPHGNHLLATYGKGQEKLLILCHMDTVWEEGTLKEMPFKIEGERVFGPGIFDMKAGIAFAWFVIKAFKETNITPKYKMLVLITSDEETGSETAHKYIEKYAQGCKAALVLEPAGEGGALKTFRKGLGMLKVKIKGRAAHAGLDHRKGISAIKELAHFTLAAEELTDYQKGTTVNVGVIRGGTSSNVVPAEAMAEIDFRFSEPAEGVRVENILRNYTPRISGTEIEVTGGIDRGPLLRTEAVQKLFELAKNEGQKMGMELKEISAGGVSDGNFTSAMGIPTLDGLGAVGGGAHASEEHIIITESLQRMALLYRLINVI